MSRQRLRPSLAESVSQPCPHCAGTGRIRSINSAALQILRVVEEEAGTNPGQDITIYVHPDVALYILNQKRASLASLEEQFGIAILLEADATLIPPDFRMGNDYTDSDSCGNSGVQNRQGRNKQQAHNKSEKEAKSQQRPRANNNLKMTRSSQNANEEVGEEVDAGKDAVTKMALIFTNDEAEAVITEALQPEQSSTHADNDTKAIQNFQPLKKETTQTAKAKVSKDKQSIR